MAARLTSMFFFSSRRRHTRFDCDWSSDVCSSDLGSVEVEDAACRGDDAVGGGLRQPLELLVVRSEEHTSELQSQSNLVCRLLLEKKKNVKSYASLPCSRARCDDRSSPLASGLGNM